MAKSPFPKGSVFAQEEERQEKLRIGKIEQLTQAAKGDPEITKVSAPSQSPQELESINYLLNEALGHFASGNHTEGVRIVEQVRDQIYGMLR